MMEHRQLERAHLQHAGKFTSRGEWIHPTVTIDTTELIINTDGNWSIDEAGINYEMTKGTVLFLEPALRHGGIQPTNALISFYWIHIENFSFQESGLQKHFSLREPLHASILARQLLHYVERGFESDVTDRILYILLAELLSQCCAKSGDESALAWRIRDFARINADLPLSAPDVAKEFGYNEDYVSRLMRKYYGVGLKSILSQFKIARIQYLLLETDQTLMQLSDAVGFSDYKLFLKFFKYHTGMTPSEYRELYHAIHTNKR